MPAAATIHHRSTQRFAAASPVYELYAPRSRRWRAVLSLTLGLLSLLLAAVRSQAVLVMFPDFSNTTGLIINGDATTASTSDGKVLRLTPALTFQAGSVFTTTPVNTVEFSTAFEFRFSSRNGSSDGVSVGADGIAFVLQSIGPTALGDDGQGIGYKNIGSASVAVEFDTFLNLAESDPSSNHIGINTNGSVVSLPNLTANIIPDFDSSGTGAKWTAWVDYDGSVLEVRVSNNGERPLAANLAYTVNLSLPSLLNSSTAYIGFTSATGGAYARHEILSWSYSDMFHENGIAVASAVPEPGVSALLGVGLGLLLWRHRERLHSAKRT